MTCPRCGASAPDTAKFCTRCGQPLAAPQAAPPVPPTVPPSPPPQPQPPQRRSSLRALAVVLSVLVVALGVVIAIIVIRHNGPRSYDDCMALAARYLEELDLERAEAMYLEAIQLDPSQVEAYRALAELYIQQERFEDALDILERGIEATGSGELQQMYDELRARLAPEEEPEAEPEQEAELPDHSGDLALFAGLLQTIHDNPSDYIDPQANVEDCTFTVADLDEDGRLELAIRFNSSFMAGLYGELWEVSGEGELVQQDTIGIFCTFYTGGFLREDAGHNQSDGQTVWPYSLLRYDEASQSYNFFASASCVDEWVDYSGSYSAALDADGDGTIYYFTLEGEESEPLTLEQYEALVNQYIPAENELPLIWSNLTEENIRLLVE